MSILRRRRTQPEAVTAAVRALTGPDRPEPREQDVIVNNTTGLARIVWDYWEGPNAVPELAYAVGYVANALSLANLYVTRDRPGATDPVAIGADDPAAKLFGEFCGGQLGQSALLEEIGTHLAMTGDTILAGPKPDADAGPYFETWQAYAGWELFSRDGVIFWRDVVGREQSLPSTVSAFRCYVPNPLDHNRAQARVFSCLGVLEELRLLQATRHAALRSRLTGPGVFFIPDGIDFPGGVNEFGVSEIVREFGRVAGIAVKNPGSVEAMVPIVLQGNAEAIAAAKLVTFTNQILDRIVELQDSAVQRLARGLDLPADIVSGSQGQSNSWSAWETDESTIRMHIRPLLGRICNALTWGWLQPALVEAGIAGGGDLRVWYSDAKARTRPNAVSETQAAYDRLETDGAALRLVSGLSPDTEPDQKEYTKQLLQKIALSGSPQAPDAINALGTLGYLDPKTPTFYDITRQGPVQNFPEPGGGPPGAPESTPPPQSIPGQRSQDKRVTPPPAPAPGDRNNNQPVGRN